MNFANLAIFQLAATRGSRSLAYELIELTSTPPLRCFDTRAKVKSKLCPVPSCTALPLCKGYKDISKGYNVAFEFVFIFMATLEELVYR